MVFTKSDFTIAEGVLSDGKDEPCELQAVCWFKDEDIQINMENISHENINRPTTIFLLELQDLLDKESQEIIIGEDESSDIKEIIQKISAALSIRNLIESENCVILEEELNSILSEQGKEYVNESASNILPKRFSAEVISQIDDGVCTRNDIKQSLRFESSDDFAVIVGCPDSIKRTVLLSIKIRGGCGLRHTSSLIRHLFILLGSTKSSLDYNTTTRLIFEAMSINGMTVDEHEEVGAGSPLQTLKNYIEELIAEQVKRTDECASNGTKEIDSTSVKNDMPLKEGKTIDPLKRTGRPFGGVFNDMRQRYPQYWSDIRDAFNLKCLAAIVFIYFVCITQVITFGGLMVDKTDGWMGVSELLVVTSVAGVIFSLLSAQPLLIVGTTGPTVLFEEALYLFCQATGLEFLTFRLWVCVWVAVVALVVVFFEGSFLVRYFSRFVMEIFTLMISVIFIYEVFNKLFKIFKAHPLQDSYCHASMQQNSTDFHRSNLTENFTIIENKTWGPNGTLLASNITSIEPMNQPNTALLSLILTFATFAIAYTLKDFRNTRFLTRRIRLVVSDFAIPIAVVINVLIDFFIKDTYTQKLNIPSGFEPTTTEKREWVINPFGSMIPLPIWAYFAAVIPGLLAFILIFIQTQISGVIAAKKSKKGTGFHLDLLLVGSFGVLSGFFGLPLLTITTVRSLAHISALSVMRKPQTPDEAPKLKELKEQRVTAFIVHVLIGLSVFLSPILQKIPLTVLFGVFLFMGIAILRGSELFVRIKLLFIPSKHHPKRDYVTSVTTKKMHLYTLIQVGCLVVLWGFKFTPAALAVPFLIASLIPVRKFILPAVFNTEELNVLDKHEDN